MFFQLLHVLGELLPRLHADDERNQQLPDPASFEVERDRGARARPVGERVHVPFGDRGHRPCACRKLEFGSERLKVVQRARALLLG